MTNVDPPLRSGPWTWRCLPASSPGRTGVADVQLWHEALSLPVLDVTDGAWALAAPSFAADGSQLQFDVVTLANKARFRVTVDLAAGCWRSPGERRGLPVAALQQRYGSSSAIAAWPVVPPAPVVPAREMEREAPPSSDEAERGPEAVVVTAPTSAAASTAESPAREHQPTPPLNPDGPWRVELAEATA